MHVLAFSVVSGDVDTVGRIRWAAAGVSVAACCCLSARCAVVPVVGCWAAGLKRAELIPATHRQPFTVYVAFTTATLPSTTVQVMLNTDLHNDSIPVAKKMTPPM